MKGRRVLITGVTGFVGSHLAELLVEKGHKVYGLKQPDARLRNVRQLGSRITLIDGDLIDESSIIQAIRSAKPHEIYHLGALSWVTPSWRMPAAYMQVNAIGTINLFEAMRVASSKARVLVSCTPEEYGDVPPEMLPITEETRIAPVNPYAASKVAQDAVCQVYHASYGIPVIRTRAFNHEGPRREVHGAIASFAYQIARIEAGMSKPVVKVGNLEARRNFTDVRDMVRAYFMAMKFGLPGELYLIGSKEVYTMKQCLRKLINMSHKRKEISYQVEKNRIRPTELRRFEGDFKKFMRLTGWKQEIVFDQTLRDVLDYWRERVKLER